jgi:PAS domain S-box-containing protein
MLMVPLTGRTGAVGAIGIFRHKGGQAYAAEDRSFLIDVSNITALAIENCALFDSLQAEISARLSTARALDISEQRFQSIFESTSLGIKVLDLTGNIVQTNSAFQKIIGYPEDEIVGRRFYDFLHPADMARAVSMFQKFKSEGVSALRFQHRAIHKNGSTVWVNAVFSAVRKSGDDDGLAFIVSILEDITDQKLFESELVEVKNRLQNTLELERLRLAHELHDGPMQELYSVIYEIEELREKADPQVRYSLGNVSQSIQGVLQELRTTAKELRPPTISQFGLEKTIRSYVGDLQDKHPELLVHLSLAHDHQLLPEEVRLALFRIFQQSMSNIVRHAHATETRVRFSFDAEEARLEIHDNGKGFQVPSSWIELVREGHFGLAGAAERVNALGGVFVVESHKTAGTTVRTVIPWKEHLA